MCDWGGGPYGNGSYNPEGIRKHERDDDPLAVCPHCGNLKDTPQHLYGCPSNKPVAVDVPLDFADWASGPEVVYGDPDDQRWDRL